VDDHDSWIGSNGVNIFLPRGFLRHDDDGVTFLTPSLVNLGQDGVATTTAIAYKYDQVSIDGI